MYGANCTAFQRKQYFRKQPLKVHVSAGLRHSLRCPLGKGKIEVIHVDNIAASLSLQKPGEGCLPGGTAAIKGDKKGADRFSFQQAEHEFFVIHGANPPG